MPKKVLAVNSEGKLTYCTAPPDRRGLGRCNHGFHQEEGEDKKDFIRRVASILKVETKEKTNEDRIVDIVQDNAMSFNKDPNWNDIVGPLIPRFFRMGENIASGRCIQEATVNEFGDEVNKLTLEIEYEGETYVGDFGEVPKIADDGTFTINGVPYRCLPVVSRNKVGFGQGYSIDKANVTTNEDEEINGDGEDAADVTTLSKAGATRVPTIWLYQMDGNLGVTIPVEGEYCTILGKRYKKSDIEEAIINPPHKNPRVASVLASLDPRIADRVPSYGKEGFFKDITENFQSDQINDLEWREIFTYEKQVGKELTLQLKRMGNTFRDGISKKGVPVIYQSKNTENVKNMLLGRSNVQSAENLNPLAAYSQAHKVSLVGLEGYKRDDCPEALRIPGESYRGISDPLDQSSGKGVGQNIFLKNCDVSKGYIVKVSGRDDLSLSDFVPFTNHNNPNRVSMATSQIRQAMPLIHGEDPRKLGDARSDRAWSTISGAAMGVNLRTAYLTGEKEWEDSATISESARKKLSAIKTFNFGKDEKFHDGDFVRAGTYVSGKQVKYDGTLKAVGNGFSIEVEVPFVTGNKIAGRFGNKCTIGKILPDDQMPKIWNNETKRYEPAEVIMSPISIGKRGNIGAILETQNGSLNSADIVPVVLPDGKTVKANNGKQFIMRLNQIAQEKNHAHGGELGSNGEFHARFGEMESILMTTTENRRKVLKYLKNQGTDEEGRLDSLMKSIGVVRKKK